MQSETGRKRALEAGGGPGGGADAAAADARPAKRGRPSQEKEEDLRRPRHKEEELLREAIIGFVDDGGEDPPQSGVSLPRQSRAVLALAAEGGEVPVAKDQRAGYVWVAGAKGSRKRYTWNVDRMEPLPPFKDADDNTCDVCGCSCTEVLYEFRCYRRLRRILY